MALSAEVLNSEATLNLWVVLNSRDFIPGEELKLVFRIMDPDVAIRYIPPSTTVATFYFNKSDNTQFSKVASLNTDDRSLATITLQESETEDLVGGNIFFDLDLLGTGAEIKKGIIPNALRRSGDC